jgi:hypothetical protein
MRSLTLLCAVLFTLPLSGCGGQDFRVDIDTPPHNAEGVYTSGDTGGPLGRLRLELTLRENALRTYDATLSSLDDPRFGESTGVGTVGNEHIILNFDPGDPTDYYFEGALALTGGAVSGIEGRFVWPDQTENLSAVFARNQ